MSLFLGEVQPYYRNDNKSQKGYFSEIICPVILLGQVFGTFSVVGTTKNMLNELNFKWKGFRLIYCVCVQISILIMSSFSAIIIWLNKIEFSRVCKLFSLIFKINF